MGRQEDIRIQFENVPPSLFAELIQCPEVLAAHHKHLNDNEWIKVGPFEGAYRRVAYISPWECSSNKLKRLVPYDLLKIVEKQHLQLIKDGSGMVTEAILTTQPSIVSVPVVGTIKMGTVIIRACTEPDFDGCVVHTHLDCSAKGLGWLWMVKSFVEEMMLVNARRVALHCIEFIVDVARGDSSTAGLWEEMQEGKRSAPLGVDADVCQALTLSEGTCDSSRSRGCEEAIQRSLSHASITSAASAASVYFDAPEDPPDNPSYSETGADKVKPQEVTSRLQRGSSYDFIVTAGTVAAAAQTRHARTGSFSGGCHATTKGAAAHQVPLAWKQAAKQAQHGPAKDQRLVAQTQPQMQAQAQPKERRTFWDERRSDLLLHSQGRLNPTLEALHQTLHKLQQDVNIIREHTSATTALHWQAFTQGLMLGACASVAAGWLLWRTSRLKR